MELFFGCFMVFVCIRGHELRSDEDKGKWEARFGRHHRGRRRKGQLFRLGKRHGQRLTGGTAMTNTSSLSRQGLSTFKI